MEVAPRGIVYPPCKMGVGGVDLRVLSQVGVWVWDERAVLLVAKVYTVIWSSKKLCLQPFALIIVYVHGDQSLHDQGSIESLLPYMAKFQ